MSRYLVLGNGFDLAHQLPTAYKDFLYICANVIGAQYEDGYDDVKRQKMNCLLSVFKSNYKDIDEEIKDNIWIQHFLSVYKNRGEKWIDFEREIRKVCFMYNSDGFEGIKKFTCITSKYNFYEVKNFVDIMKKDLNNLINILNKYLLVLPYDFCNVYYEEVFNYFATDVINFNYTDTQDKIYDHRVMIDYVHGKISEKSSSIVLGFDGMENDEDDVKYGEFLKYFQMVEKNIRLISYHKLLDEENSNKSSAMFFGHSLDKTDADVIRNIILKVNKVDILYYNDEHKKQMIKNLITIFGRNKFIELTLSNHRRIYFHKQSLSKLLDKNGKETIKKMYDYIRDLNFNSCDSNELSDVLNNGFITKNSNIILYLKEKLDYNKHFLGSDNYKKYKDLLNNVNK